MAHIFATLDSTAKESRAKCQRLEMQNLLRRTSINGDFETRDSRPMERSTAASLIIDAHDTQHNTRTTHIQALLLLLILFLLQVRHAQSLTSSVLSAASRLETALGVRDMTESAHDATTTARISVLRLALLVFQQDDDDE